MPPTEAYGVPGLWKARRARTIDGASIAAALRTEVASDVAAFAAERGWTPALATVLIGDDPASAVYVGAKIRACQEVGLGTVHHHLPGDASRTEALALIDSLNADPAVAGILCQLPVPAGLDAGELVDRVDPGKDVDGLTIANAGRLALGLPGLRPCTPAGVMRLLAAAGIDPAGRKAVVMGRSNLFGKPVAQLLTQADTTVTVCHSRTPDLREVAAGADILIVAVGKAEMVTGDWVRPGAVVIDVGISRTAKGVVGDVHFDSASRVAGAITPVPGGVGPMTIACLLRNTLEAARAAGSSRDVW